MEDSEVANKQLKPAEKRTKAGKPASRKPGRPKRAKRPIGPAELTRMSRLRLAGKTHAEIGRAIAISETTVRHHLDTTIRPLWAENVCDPLGQELAKIALLERTAWERFNSDAPVETTVQVKDGLAEGGVERVTHTIRRPGQRCWLEIVQWCIEQRCKLAGYYAETKPKREHGGGRRVAGLTAGQVNDEMLQRVAKSVRDRKKYEDSLKAGKGRDN